MEFRVKVLSGSSIPVVRALRVRKDRVRFPAPRPVFLKPHKSEALEKSV